MWQALAFIAIVGCEGHDASLNRPPVDTAVGVCLTVVTVSPASTSVHVGDTTRFSVHACGTVPNDWRWRMSDTGVATVDSVSGLARGKARGLTSVIAVYLRDPTVSGAGVVNVVP